MSLGTVHRLQPASNAQRFLQRLLGQVRSLSPLMGGMIVVTSLLVGCQPKEEIQTYYVESDSPAASQAKPSQSAATPSLPPNSASTKAASTNAAPTKDSPKRQGPPTDRMIAAIVPSADQAWFIKLVGPKDQVTAAEEQLDSFFAQLKIEQEKPVWELPEGWEVGPEKTMRLATLLVPVKEPADSNSESSETADESKPLELSIIGLPMMGEWSSQVLSNVNRWRGQLGRDPLTASLLEEMTTPLAISEGAIRFDSTGWFSDGGMSSGGGAPFAPFAGGVGKAASQPKPPTPSQPAARPNSMTNAPAVPIGSGQLKHTPPEGWTDLPGSAMRKASLSTPDGATVTAFVFPATAPAMADPLANVNRWRGEVGLASTNDKDLADTSETIPVAAGEATYVELVGETETTLAAMTPRGDQVWFFKLRGPKASAEAQRDAFKQWLGSIEL